MVKTYENKVDTKRKPYVTHDPVTGYRYIPNTEMELLSPDGRKYMVRINSRGIRSDREYSPEKSADVFRAFVLGDSMAAGQYVNNEERFTEELERIFPGTEFINLGLEGTGTDQQFLIFREYAASFEYDAVILCPFVENIRRNTVRYRLTVDLESRRWILTPKPRFEENPDGAWRWTGIPVPAKRIFFDEAPPDILKDTDFGGSDVNCGMKNNAKASISRFLEKTKTKGFIYSLIKYEPYQEYKNLYGKPWRTMKAILSEFSKLAVGKKFIIAPITPYSFLKYNLANAYKLRFASECRYFFDILPYLKGLSAEEKKNVFISDDCHFSAFGHKKVAAAFAGELTRSGILKK